MIWIHISIVWFSFSENSLSHGGRLGRPVKTGSKKIQTLRLARGRPRRNQTRRESPIIPLFQANLAPFKSHSPSDFGICIWILGTKFVATFREMKLRCLRIFWASYSNTILRIVLQPTPRKTTNGSGCDLGEHSKGTVASLEP